MIVEAIPSEVQVFLTSDVRSLAALELLLLLRAERGKCWSAAELGRELRTNTEWAEGEVASLIQRGLVEPAPGQSDPGGAPCYRYAQTKPPAAASEFALGWLAAAYPARRFSIIQALYAPQNPPSSAAPPPAASSDALKSFADAFKIIKEPPAG
ncbi:MAG TPA: hypothetical protein VEB22_06765 [Phycisphaerales bacterium]|nr:hypothetical protein [Phycisphaerales bacterium]